MSFDNDESKNTIVLHEPPFTQSLFECGSTQRSVPKPNALPQDAANLEFAFDVHDRNIFCKNGVVVSRAKWLQGNGVLSLEFADSRLAEIAYYVEKLPLHQANALVFIQNHMLETRRTKSFCSFLDLIQIIVKSGLYGGDIVVQPRLKMMIDLFTLEQATESTKLYRTVDVATISQQTYISLTFTVLAWIFTGVPARMLVFNDTLLHPTAIVLHGQEFWKFIHFCVPSFSWHFQNLFSTCFVTSFQRKPQFFQYDCGESMAIVIWLALAQYFTIVKAACKFYVNKKNDDAMARGKSLDALVNEYLKRDLHTKVSAEEKQRFLEAAWIGFLLLETPSPLANASISDFNSVASFLHVSSTSLYICKSMIEFEQLHKQK